MRSRTLALLATTAFTVTTLGLTATSASAQYRTDPLPADADCSHPRIDGEAAFEVEGDEISPGKHETVDASWYFSSDLRTMYDWEWLGPPIIIDAVLVKGEETDWNVYHDEDGGFLETLHAPDDSSGRSAVITHVIVCVDPDSTAPLAASCSEVGGDVVPMFERQEGEAVDPGLHWNDYLSWTISEDRTTMHSKPFVSEDTVHVIIVKGVDAPVRHHIGLRGLKPYPNSSGDPAEIEYFEVCTTSQVRPEPPADPTCSDSSEDSLLLFERQEGAAVAPGEHSNEFGSWTVDEEKIALDFHPVDRRVVEGVWVKGFGVGVKFYGPGRPDYLNMRPPLTPSRDRAEIEYFYVCTRKGLLHYLQSPTPTPTVEPTHTATPTATGEPVPTRLPGGQVNADAAGTAGASGSGNPLVLAGLLLLAAAAVAAGSVIMRRRRA